MTNKRALLTGAGGFIGQAMFKRLTEMDCEILCLKQDDYYQAGFKKMLETFNPQVIIHMGSYGNHSSQTDDQAIFEANVVKTYLLLDSTKDIPYEAFLNFGSSSEYGNKSGSMREEDVLEPLTMYAGTKAAGTMLARVFAKEYDKPIVTVRPFSIYGEEEADFRFIPTVIRAIVRDEELVLDRLPNHDWTYIEDFLDGVLTVIEHASQLSGNVINIGTGKQYRNEEVVNLISFLAGKTPKIKETETPHRGLNWVANNSLLKLCGWRQNTQLMDGLRKTCVYYMEKYDKQGS